MKDLGGRGLHWIVMRIPKTYRGDVIRIPEIWRDDVVRKKILMN